MSKVWVVTSGEYYDLQVPAVYDNACEAERIAKLMGGECREFDVNVFQHDEPLDGMHYYHFSMDKAGNNSCRDSNFSLDEYGKLYEEKYYLKISKGKRFRGTMRWNLYVFCYAKSKEGAIKIADDLRVQLLNDPTKPKEGKLSV